MLLNLKRLRYINEKQLLMIQQKITKRKVEIVNHRDHFNFIHVHP